MTPQNKEKHMKPRSYALASVLSAAALSAASLTPARAQVTLDVAKITCEQFLNYKITDPRDIALWINGYYNGQNKNTVLDTQKLKDHFGKVKDFCILNMKMPVFDATQKVLDLNK
jgi:hypothetical protein